MARNSFLSIVCGVSLIGGNIVALPAPHPEIKIADRSIQQKIDEIDVLVDKALESLRIPGIAVGVVVDGKVVLTKGYGVRKFSDPLPVTENTLFGIGSCTKAFTTFALGQLVDEGVVAWEDPVIKYIPEFRLYDLHATHYLTLRDLATHRSGLPRHDLVWYNAKFSMKEILNRLPYLGPTCDLREKFQYNNLMYAVAGLVIERVTNQPWEEFVAARIFQPLGMARSNFSVEQVQHSDDFAFPHTEKNEQIEAIPFRSIANVGPAGCINSSVDDMSRWIQLQLSEGGNLISPEVMKEMHVVHMSVPSQSAEGVFGLGYGLGWFIGLHKGHYLVAHAGGIDGFSSIVILLPEEKVGVVVLTNSDNHFFFPLTAALSIADLLLGKNEERWLSKLQEKEQWLKQEEGQVNLETAPMHPLEHYVGEFEHPGYGTIQIGIDHGELEAIQNDLPFVLKHQGYDHFLGISKIRENYKFEASFSSNATGEIAEFHATVEPALPPIVFKRKTSNELRTYEYLKKFVGTYKCSMFSVAIDLKKGRLVATVPGQPSCEIKPEKHNFFSLKEIPNCALQFIVEPDGTISALDVHYAGATYTLKAK